MEIPHSPGWIALIVLMVIPWATIGVIIFRLLVRDEVLEMMNRTDFGRPMFTPGERKVMRWVVTPLLIIIWPCTLIIGGTVRMISIALDDRSNRIRKIKKHGLPSDQRAIKFLEDLHERTKVPYPEIMQYINRIYDTHKIERGWEDDENEDAI